MLKPQKNGIHPSIHAVSSCVMLSFIFLSGLYFLVPLAGTVQRLLKVVLHDCGIARAEERDRAGLQSTLAAALTEPGVTVDIKVEYGGRRAFPIARIDCHL